VDVIRMERLLDPANEEAWRSVSNLFAQMFEILLRHGGTLVSNHSAVFEAAREHDTEFCVEAVRAATEIQRVARLAVKRLAREMKIGLGVGLGVAVGPALLGYFGAGDRVDYAGLGPVFRTAAGLALQANDGEILVDQGTFGKIRLFVNTQRLAPMSLPGVAGQVHVYRVIPL
jgi:adenylate cyclase